MILPMKNLLQKALRGKYAVPALNVNSMEMVQAVFSAAEKARSPVIIAVSPSALSYSGDLLPAIVSAEAKQFPKIPFALHLDHGKNFDDFKKSIQLGFSSVMVDASIDYEKKVNGVHPARSFSQNVAITKKVVKFAHAKKVSVEAEIGTLGGIEDSTVSSEHLTDPEEAEAFVEETGIDCLAIAIGTSHGAYKFKGNPKLAFNVLEKTHKLLPKTPLVLHGASSVPEGIVEQCKKFGLQISSEAQGVPVPQLQKAISLGICKINIDTDSRLAFMGAILQKANEYKGPVDLREYFGAGKQALEELYLQKMKDFGSAGKN